MSTALAGGVGGTQQELCGALSGGVLVIGALHGRQLPDEDDTVAYELSARFRSRFLADLGCTRCAALRAWVEAPGGPGTCAIVVEKAAMILLELLAEKDQGAGAQPR